jgi:hypothetical protein
MDANRWCQEQKKYAKHTLLPGKPLHKEGLQFQMRSRQYIDMLNFVYEHNIKM